MPHAHQPPRRSSSAQGWSTPGGTSWRARHDPKAPDLMRQRLPAEEWKASGPRRPALVTSDALHAESPVQKRPEIPRPSFHDMTSRLSAIERAPVFFTLSEEALRAIARRVRRMQIPAGEMVLCQGEPGDTIFFIERGHCRLVIEKPPSIVTVAVLTEGDGDDARWLFDHQTAVATLDEEDRVARFPLAKDHLAGGDLHPADSPRDCAQRFLREREEDRCPLDRAQA